ncbi:unnamed protein product [Angiostrongylus costaricensis]|uniref:CSN8_PSD8_EIF3K domain-containing protein n=1 Tax=Angiostrongylus costaricensis TaxID=334426 RepID=A0A0R3PZS0_ANGCS|nr:unnamed protein product [Angiostrongylus costaricensis]
MDDDCDRKERMANVLTSAQLVKMDRPSAEEISVAVLPIGNVGLLLSLRSPAGCLNIPLYIAVQYPRTTLSHGEAAVCQTSGVVRSASCPPPTYVYSGSQESTSHDTATQAAKEAVFNMLYQYQAIPVKAKILSDCILSTLDESEVTNLLDSAGWSRSDYLRGYRTMVSVTTLCIPPRRELIG